MAEITLSNRMTAKYDLIGTDESQIDIEVIVGTYVYDSVNIEVGVRAEVTSDILISAEIVYPGSSEVLIDVIPKQHNNVLIEADVNPHNRMTAIYEIVEAPFENLLLGSIQDTFVTQNYPYSTINYGGSNSIKIGQDNNGENKAFLKFDLSSIPLAVNLKSAKLKLYYNTYNGQSIDVHNVLGEWTEFGLTYSNINFETSLTNSSIRDDEVGRYIEIDIIELATLWVNGVINDGLMLTSNDYVDFYKTRESGQSPILDISYYKPGDYELSTSRILIDAISRIENHSDIRIDADVKNDFANSDILISMFAHQPDEVFNEDINIDVEVPEYNSTSEVLIEAKIQDESLSEVLIEAEVTVYEAISDILIDANITELTGDSVLIEAEVKLYNGDSSVEIEVGINGYERSIINIEAEVIGYNENNDILIDVEIIGYERSEILIDSEVIGYEDYSEILIEVGIPEHVDSEVLIDVEINLYERFNDVEIDVDVPVRLVDRDVQIEAGVLGYGDAEVLIDMYPRVPYISDAQIQVTIRPPRKANIYVYMI